MANIKSAKKRAIQQEKRNLRNRMIMSEVKTVTKNYLKAIEVGDVEAAKELYPTVAKKWDMAAQKGVVHKNAANRKKSLFNAKLNSIAK